MQFFDKAIYWLSSGLLIPVLIAVIYFLVRALMQLGGLYSVYINRIRYNKLLDEKMATLDKSNVAALSQLSPAAVAMLPVAITKLVSHPDSQAHTSKVIADFTNDCEKDLDKSRTLSKTGPILGLMGTLIPMGPALAGLAAGDIATMSQQMQVAFNTTVMGLVIGTCGFLILQLKQRWYQEDLNRIEFINDIIHTGYVKQ